MNHSTGILYFLLAISMNSSTAQERYYTKSGEIRFSSESSLEKIEAINRNVTCVLDTRTGLLQLMVLMKGFEFKKALMQEHFNENYVESDKYPKSEFKGQVLNSGEIKYNKDGSYELKIRGLLSMHGVTKEVETIGKITVSGEKIESSAAFNILLSDFKIKIPTLVKENVSNKVTITVSCLLDILKS